MVTMKNFYKIAEVADLLNVSKDTLRRWEQSGKLHSVRHPMNNYRVDRKLYPNVDFYSGIIYRALGIPVNMFTVMFAMGRLPGWVAQWKEMIESPDMKIGRPRQIYTGPTEISYEDAKKKA